MLLILILLHHQGLGL